MTMKTTCTKVSKLCQTSYVYFSKYARIIEIIFVRNSPGIILHLVWMEIPLFNFLYKKDDSNGETRCALIKRKYVWFYQLFALREKNQTRFELSSEVFDAIVGWFSSRQSARCMQSKAKFMHKSRIVGSWIVGSCITQVQKSTLVVAINQMPGHTYSRE